MINVGVNLDNCDHKGNTLLHYFFTSFSQKYNNEEILRFIFDAGVNLNNRNDKQMTHLMVCAKSDLKGDEYASLLIEYGADPFATDNDNRTALYYAEKARKY
jgi:ankyrin repeat protein